MERNAKTFTFKKIISKLFTFVGTKMILVASLDNDRFGALDNLFPSLDQDTTLRSCRQSLTCVCQQAPFFLVLTAASKWDKLLLAV